MNVNPVIIGIRDRIDTGLKQLQGIHEYGIETCYISADSSSLVKIRDRMNTGLKQSGKTIAKDAA